MTVPYTFANASSPVPASELDANFAAVEAYSNTAGTVVNPVQANITSVGTLSSLSVSGNITTPDYFIGNGALLTGITAVSSYGNPNVAVFMASFGSNAISTTGNITASKFIGNGALLTGLPAGYTNSNVVILLNSFGSNTISTTGTITGGNITGGNLLTGGLVSATGNVTGGNIRTAGQVSATANITGGNVLTGGLVSATGNISGNYILGNGSQLTGLPATYGNSNVAAYLANFGSSDISTTGNITGGNLAVAGPITVTGGGAVQIGDSTLTANSLLGGTATIGPGSVTSTRTMSATGNITGGNLLSSGAISAAGNVYDVNGQIFNVPASYAKYTRTTQQTGSLVANTVIVCNVSENTFGSGISVNTGTGQVTLQAGKTYRLRGSVPGWTTSGSNGTLQWCWYNETTPGWLGSSGENYPGSSGASYGAAGGSAEAVFTPGVTTVVSFRILSSNNISALGGNGDFSTTASYPWIDVQVIGGLAPISGYSTTGNVTASIYKTTPLTTSTLPTAASAGNGARAFVTDANSNAFANLLVGSGIYSVPVFSNGTNWYIG